MRKAVHSVKTCRVVHCLTKSYAQLARNTVGYKCNERVVEGKVAVAGPLLCAARELLCAAREIVYKELTW